MKLLALILSVLPMLGCERRTIVKFAGGNPPTFVIAGSGSLAVVTIYGPEREQTQNPFDDTGAIWKIVAEGGYLNGEPVEKLRSITYGIVPQGYNQVIPAGAESPPALVAGKRYSYWFDTTNAPHDAGFFEIKEGKATLVKGPDSCFDFRDGKWTHINCEK
jgi:hypothetical protein